MSTQQGDWQRTRDLFFAALERDASERAAFLAAACAGDEALHAEVLSLLESHDDSDDFISRPAALQALGDPLTDARRPSWIGRRLGGYRVVESVGHGGMSEVYRAVRDDDEFRKDVAVKVLRSGYDTASLLRRFSVERQILATLDHPNIARLLDAGSTEEGLPYLVMDFIKGRAIDEYCREHGLTVRARLELFRSLCDAVQHVHRHLMVHGDLKCSNILVTEDGTVKLLDFGIAKLLNPDPASPADAKLTGIVALTPEYASPEQIRGQPITTASDVYSLGVLLYRLLSGASPYRGSHAAPYELAKQICEQEPYRPSVAARLSVSREFESFWHTLAGDLDSIVMLALRKEPGERYASVEQLSADVGRYLDGYPVIARGPSVGYQALKFLGRHKAFVATAALLLVSLVGGIFATSRQARIADEERWRAERHFASVRELANTFMFDVHAAIENLPGATPARQLLVVNSLKYLDTLTAESSHDPSLQRELAAAYEKVADVQGGFRQANLGDYGGAMASYRKALAIRAGLVKALPGDRDVRRDLMRNHGKLSEMLSDGDSQAAIGHAREALNIAEELAAGENAKLEDRRNVASSLLSLGWQFAKSGQTERGVQLMNHAAMRYEALLTEAPQDVAIRRVLMLAHERMGETQLRSRRSYEAAYTNYAAAHRISATLLAGDPQNVWWRKAVAYALLGMGEARLRQGSPQLALEKQRQAAEMFRALLEADPKNENARFDAGLAAGRVSESLLALKDAQGAARWSEDAIAILAQAALAAESAGPSFTRVQLALNHFRSGAASALQAERAGANTAARAQLCRRARDEFLRSEPVLAAASQVDDVWHGGARDLAKEIPGYLAPCGAALASASGR
jgi:eukaryotic-like serine/threonine-protein kinase